VSGAILFGKLPTHGDFVARGLNAEARDLIDNWLSNSLAAARATDDFEERYDSVPPCRYVNPNGPDASAGVLVASIDAAGRRFPLLLALTDIDPGRTAAAAEVCEDLVYRAFAQSWSADELYAAARQAELAGREADDDGTVATRWWSDGGECFAPVECDGRFPPDLLSRMLAGGGQIP
jgi:type VI secretion system protein ImpM